MTYRVKVTDAATIECDNVDEVLLLLQGMGVPTRPPTTMASYSSSLYYWIMAADANRDVRSMEAIRALWEDESWIGIMQKARSVESENVVWWMDGLRKYMSIDLGNQQEQSSGIQSG